MNRKQFLQTLGISAAAIAFIDSIEGCKKNDNTTIVDFTIDISSAQYSNLNTAGGYAYNQGVIIAKTSAGDFIAVAQACTHQGTSVQYNLSQDCFVCPLHGAKYNDQGGVTLGPATVSLTKYNTSLSGTSLRVFS